jgi:hypothetical protein
LTESFFLTRPDKQHCDCHEQHVQFHKGIQVIVRIGAISLMDIYTMYKLKICKNQSVEVGFLDVFPSSMSVHKTMTKAGHQRHSNPYSIEPVECKVVIYLCVL